MVAPISFVLLAVSNLLITQICATLLDDLITNFGTSLLAG